MTRSMAVAATPGFDPRGVDTLNRHDATSSAPTTCQNDPLNKTGEKDMLEEMSKRD